MAYQTRPAGEEPAPIRLLVRSSRSDGRALVVAVNGVSKGKVSQGRVDSLLASMNNFRESKLEKCPSLPGTWTSDD